MPEPRDVRWATLEGLPDRETRRAKKSTARTLKYGLFAFWTAILVALTSYLSGTAAVEVSVVVIVALLALGTAARYFFVTRLGERVVADLRKAVFARVVTLSPGFFERVMTGEILSRITTDTTLILSVIGSSVSYSLRNMLIFSGGLVAMLITSVKLTGLVLLEMQLLDVSYLCPISPLYLPYVSRCSCST